MEALYAGEMTEPPASKVISKVLTAAGNNLETLKIIKRRFWFVWNLGLKSSSGPIGSVVEAGIRDDDIHWV
jgi:hypothetical protein